MAYLECDIGFDREDLLYTLCSLNLWQLVHSDTHEEENKPVIKFLVGLIHSFPDLWLLRVFFPLLSQQASELQWACTSQDLTKFYTNLSQT